jgi:hypothetical protein
VSWVFQGLDKRGHGIDGGWAYAPECVSSPRADNSALIFQGLGKRWHGIGSG